MRGQLRPPDQMANVGRAPRRAWAGVRRRPLASRPGGVLLFGVLGLLGATLQVPHAAEAVSLPRNFSFTLIGEPGASIPGGQQWSLNESNARLVIQDYAPSRRSIDMRFDVPGSYVRWDVQVAGTLDGATMQPAPLVTGHYPRAVRPIAAEPGEAGLEVAGGLSCTNHGSFDIRALHFSGGVVDRLWLVFEMSCGVQPMSYFGEIRIGMDTPALAVSPAAIAWPDHVYHRGARGVPLQVRTRSTGDARVRSVELTGAHPRQFQILQDDCTGRQINRCKVMVTFDPTRPGPATAVLRIATSRGVRRTLLDGLGAVGTTRLDLVSESGDWVGQGRTYAFTPTDSHFYARLEEPYYLQSLVYRYRNQQWQRWSLDFISPASQPLSERTYTDVARAGFGNAPAMAVFGEQRGCNELTGDFTIHDLASGARGLIRHLDLTFVQYCDGSTAALRGRLRYHDGPDHTPPPQVRDLRVRRVDGRILARWSNPRPSTGFAGVTARWYRGSGATAGTPIVGRLAYAGSQTSFSMPDTAPGSPVTVSFFTHDAAGNISRPLALTR